MVTIAFWTFLFPPLWIAGVIAASIWNRRRKGKPIFPKAPLDATFSEKGCSGRSLKGALSKFGGANNCLLVYVQGNRLVITPQFPFNLMFLPEIYGLGNAVPVEKITAIVPITSFVRKALRVEFDHNGPTPVELVLNDEDGFVQAMGKMPLTQGNRDLKAPKKPTKRRKFLFGRIFLASGAQAGYMPPSPAYRMIGGIGMKVTPQQPSM